MKKDGLYRYSLQFPDDSEKRIRAGELLEKLGNKKSAVIVAALNEYLDNHPEFETQGLRIRIEQENGISRDKLERLIRTLIQEQLQHTTEPPLNVQAVEESDLIPSSEGERSKEEMPEALKEDIAQMLANLDMFQ
ncbi:MAG: hypothetical protein KH027_12790 [Clostridiales bacterium]|mgnify:FL=1|nr:hypothetical protein [Clostridiales bacterium]